MRAHGWLFAPLIGLAAFAHAQQQEQAEAPGIVNSTAGELRVEELATLEFPWGMDWLPDGRLLVTEKPGRLRIWQDGRLSEPLRGLPEISYVGQRDQGGLLDVAVDPNFEENSLIYLSYTEAADQQVEALRETGDARFGAFLNMDSDSTIRGGVLARGRLRENQLIDVEVIWRQVPKTVGRGHFGHRINFGPDGMLYLTSGERMRFDPALSPQSSLGKVLRLNPDGSIPQDNPFVDEEGALGEIWSMGHRNILSAAFDPQGRLWALEMGPLGGDELNLVEAGQNYGWPAVSNGSHYGGQTIPAHPANEEYRDPVRSWTPVISPSGAHFHNGMGIEEWEGDLLVGGLSSQALIRLRLDEDEARVALEERIDMGRRIRDVIQDQEGNIFVLVDDAEGALLRLTPTS